MQLTPNQGVSIDIKSLFNSIIKGDKRIINNVSFRLIANYDTDKNVIVNQLCC